MQIVKMASRLSLTERKSLVWKTYFGTKQHSRSLCFILRNRKWYLQLGPSISDTGWDYEIFLMNCGQSFQPFDVLMFFEDRNNNAEMFCSKTTVEVLSDKYLYGGYFKSIYEKLPGSKREKVNVVCTFYPSTSLNLDEKTYDDLEIRQSLVWNTDKPDIHKSYESPEFGLINSNWKFGIRSTNGQAGLPILEIYLRNCSGIQSFDPFEIKTFIEDKRNYVRFQCSRLYVYSPYETLFKERLDIMRQKLSGLKLYDDMRIVCDFDSYIKSTLILRNEGMEGIPKCSEDKGGSSDVKNSLINLSLGHLFNFENLSEDFGHLLEKNLFSDINLKSGKDVIPAHKIVLAARSEVFASMFQHEMTESKTGTVDIKDVEPPILQIFLKYLYSGKITETLTEDMACKLYTASDKYAVRSLQKLCSSYMAKIVDVKNFLSFLMLADTHSDPVLKNAVAEFVAERPVLMKNDDWVRFAEKYPGTANEVYKKFALKFIP